MQLNSEQKLIQSTEKIPSKTGSKLSSKKISKQNSKENFKVFEQFLEKEKNSLKIEENIGNLSKFALKDEKVCHFSKKS